MLTIVKLEVGGVESISFFIFLLTACRARVYLVFWCAHLMGMLRGCVTGFPQLNSVERVGQSVAEQPSSEVGRQNGSRQGRHVEAWKGGRGEPHPALGHLLRPEKPLAVTFIGKISKGGRTKNRWRGFLGSLDTELPLEGREGCPVSIQECRAFFSWKRSRMRWRRWGQRASWL